MTERYESLIEENTQLKKALISSKAVIDRISNDYETLKAIHEDIKLHYEKMKRDNQELGIRNQQLLGDKRELEQQFDTTIRNLKLAIEQKQREIEEIQQRVIPSFDQDMLRIRIINELEIPHRQQLEQKQSEIEKFQEQIYTLKRQVDLAEAKVETIQLEVQKEIRVAHEKFKIEVQDYQTQIAELTQLLEDGKDREQLRRLKKELDEIKQRYNVLLSENEDIRAERDKAREDRNDLMLKFSRQIDQERSEKRQFKSEAEKLAVRLRFVEDELRKEKIRRDTILTDCEVIKSDKDILQGELRKKDDTIHYLQRKITEMEEESLTNEQKNHDNVLKIYNEEHDKYLQERNKAVTTLKDLDTLKKRFSDIQDDYKALKDKYLKEQSELRDEVRSGAEEREKLKRSVGNLTKENQELERQNKMKEDQIKDLDQECDIQKKRNRELAHRLSLTETYGSQPKQGQRQYSTQNDQSPNKMDTRSTKVRFIEQENQEKLDQLQQRNSDLQAEVSKLSQQNRKLKDKLKTANEKIMDLLQKKLIEKQTTQGIPGQGYPLEQPSFAPQQLGRQQFGPSYPPQSSPGFQEQGQTGYNTKQRTPGQEQRQYDQNLEQTQHYRPSSQPGLDLDDEQILHHVKAITAYGEQGRQRQAWL